MTSLRPERWVFMLKADATGKETEAFAAKVDALGKADGFKTVDHFRGTLLVQCNEAFAKKVQAQFGAELDGIEREKFYPLPDTRPKIRKPPSP